MKRGTKILVIIAGSLAFLILLIAVLISPVAKHYIEKHSKELTGRTVTMDKLCINIFNGGVKIEGFRMLEASDSAEFVTFDTLDLRVRLFKLLKEEVNVKRIDLVGLNVNLQQNGEWFNFSDMIDHFADTTAVDTVARAEEGSGWAVGLYNIKFRHGYIGYSDLAVHSRFDLEDLNLEISGVYFSGASTDAGIGFDFARGGRIDTELSYDIEKERYDLHVLLRDFDLEGITPYLQQYMNVRALNGKLTTDLNIQGSTEHVTDLQLTGYARFTGLDLRGTEDHSLVSADTTLLVMEKIDLRANEIVFDTLLLSGLRTAFTQFPDDRNNFSDLMKPQPESAPVSDTAVTQAPEMKLLVRNFELRKFDFHYADRTLQTPFDYDVRNIRITSRDFDPAKATNAAEIRADLQGSGKLDVKWRGGMENLANQTLTVMVTNMDLRPITPHSLELFAYPVRKGTLSFTSKSVVCDYNLTSENALDIYACEVNNKRKDLKAEYKVPLKMALYIIKDVHDRIKIDLPVSGNINSPDFSYKKIILKTVVNLLVKVAVSPINFLANSLGLSPDKVNNIPINTLLDELTTEQVESLNQLAEIAASKPEMMVALQQRYDLETAVGNQALYNLKRDFYLSGRTDMSAAGLDAVDRKNIREISVKDSRLIAYAQGLDSLFIGKEVGEIARIRYPKDSVMMEVAALSAARDRQIFEYLSVNKGIPAANLKVSTAENRTVTAHKGADRYAVSMSLAGDDSENEVQAELTEEATEVPVADSVALSPTGA